MVENPQLYINFDKSLYRLTTEKVEVPFDISPDRIVSGSSVSTISQSIGLVLSGKTGFSNDETGYILGNDKGIQKFYIGTATNYLNFDGTNVLMSGSLSAATGTLGTLTITSGGHIKLGQTAYNTGTGFWLGDDSGTAKFSIGNPAGNYLTWDGAALTIKGDLIAIGAEKMVEVGGFYASDNLKNSNDTARSVTNSFPYVKYKEIKLNVDLGACRIKFSLIGPGPSGDYTFGRIYKNGVAIGTERGATNSSFSTFSEDFTGFVINDLIQIYCYKNSAGNGTIQNFRFYYDGKVDKIGGWDNLTEIRVAIDPISMTNQDP